MGNLNNVLVVGYSNPTSEGVVIHFNKKTTLKSGNISGNQFWVSWDKIGKALVNNYSESDNVAELNEQRRKEGFPCL